MSADKMKKLADLAPSYGVEIKYWCLSAPKLLPKIMSLMCKLTNSYL
jgi:hypothetical protein